MALTLSLVCHDRMTLRDKTCPSMNPLCATIEICAPCAAPSIDECALCASQERAPCAFPDAPAASLQLYRPLPRTDDMPMTPPSPCDDGCRAKALRRATSAGSGAALGREPATGGGGGPRCSPRRRSLPAVASLPMLDGSLGGNANVCNRRPPSNRVGHP